MLDTIMEFLYSIVENTIGLLPDSPFQSLVLGLEKYEEIMGMVNYVVPVGTMLNILTIYLGAVGIWYIYRWILRVAQYID